MPREARVAFNSQSLNKDGIGLDMMEDILDFLPDDAIITDFLRDTTWGESYIQVRSNDFKDSPVPYSLPHIIVNFSLDLNGDIYVSGLDMSKALDPNVILRLPSTPFNVSWSGSISTQSPPPSSPSDVLNVPDVEHDYGYNSSPATTCSHIYIKYHGLTEVFNYCSKCGKRE